MNISLSSCDVVTIVACIYNMLLYSLECIIVQ